MSILRLFRRISLYIFLVVSAAFLALLLLLFWFSMADQPLTERWQKAEQPPLKTQQTRYLEPGQLSQATLVYQQTNEAVVNITAQSTEIIYNWFFQPQPRRNESTGSGSIFLEDGHIITNSHVVKKADKLIVTLYDGEQYEAKVVGIDLETDLAVIKFDPQGRILKTLDFGNSSSVKVGQRVFAIGNPYGLERTLTQGIISGLGRPIENDAGIIIRDMIQTDASINPGNSGGPLLDDNGTMIGINTSIFSPSGGSVGIGFALPVNSAKRIVNDLISYGQVRRGWIDIQPIQLFPQLVSYAQLSVSRGLLISELKSGGNADRAGLQGGNANNAVRSGNRVIYLGGDIITAINDQKISTLGDLYGALETSKPGQTVKISYVRKGQERETKLVLTARPAR